MQKNHLLKYQIFDTRQSPDKLMDLFRYNLSLVTFLNYSANQISISQIPAERSNSTKAEL